MLYFIIFLFVMSFVFQIKMSFKTYGHFFNPIFIFNIIFFLHNWSFSFSKIIYTDLYWSTPANNDFYQIYVLLINLSCLWTFFLTCLFFCKKKKTFLIKNQYSFSIYTKMYFLFVLISLIKSFFSGGSVYGEGQALTSAEAFNPLNIILSSRAIWGSVVLINNKSKKLTIAVIFLELILSIIGGGRKSFIIILVAGLLSRYEFYQIKVKLKTVLKAFFGLFFLSYFSVFIIFFRLTSKESLDFSTRFSMTINEMNLSSVNLFFFALNSANSEGVQNWTYQLITEKKMDLIYGLSYIQSMVNTVILRPFQGELVNYQAAYYFKQIAYPGVSDHGWDFSFSAESVLNWGRMAFISYFFLALALSIFYNRRNRSDFYNTLYLLVISLLYICIRTDSTSLIRYISFFVFSFYIFRFFKIIQKRRKEKLILN
ncbi:MAG: O-antigen polysaccharide polymerase Wzy [Candidatus Shapirobacteria bacterium]|nr:O-antigen polysaccharide polymerase Wzy [Candidatus Shapirobacteria bacterium]